MITKKILIIILLLFRTIIFAQKNNSNEGIVIEYNKKLSINYQIFDPPLKIKQVKTTSEIDYSLIQGLIQSIYSASNMSWAKSDYLDKNTEIVRDNEHFEAVKRTYGNNDYSQLETIYFFKYKGSERAFIKYAFITENVPFPIISSLMAEKKNNRWYISNILNQGEVLSILSTVEPKVMNDFFKGNSIDSLNDFLSISKEDGIFSFYKMGKNFNKYMKNEKFRPLLRDRRLLYEDTVFRNATGKSIPKSHKYEIYHPFILEDAVFETYKGSKNIVKNEKTKKKYANTPELLVLQTNPIDFISKFYFSINNEHYYVIKYSENKKIKVSLIKENGVKSYILSNDINFTKWKKLFSKISSTDFIDLFQNNNNSLRKKCKGISGGINISELYNTLK